MLGYGVSLSYTEHKISTDHIRLSTDSTIITKTITIHSSYQDFLSYQVVDWKYNEIIVESQSCTVHVSVQRKFLNSLEDMQSKYKEWMIYS